MRRGIFLSFLFCRLIGCERIEGDESTSQLHLNMPNSKPQVPETYLCTAVKMDPTQTYFITGYEPNADSKTAHHMVIYGCKTPGKFDPIFHCGAMDASQDAGTPATPPCETGTIIVYAMEQNAPQFKLPKVVAFNVGGPDSGVDWLVLQVHTYQNVYLILDPNPIVVLGYDSK